MAEEREYSIITLLTTDINALEQGEPFLKLKHWRVLRRVLFGWMDKELETELKPMRYKRSLAQNRYMWGVIVPTVQAFIKETSGEVKSKDAVYAFINTCVLGYEVEVQTIFGREVLIMKGKRFSEMNTKEFADAVDKIIAHFDALGCYIQLPREKTNNTLTDFIGDD